MTQKDPHVRWTDEQWARIQHVIQEEANRARIAATFLPIIGPLPAGTDFVKREIITYPAGPTPPLQQIKIEDKDTIHLATLQVKLPLRGAQMSDPEMTSALALFRRAANVLARLEDAVIFKGLSKNASPPPEVILNGRLDPLIWEVRAEQASDGLLDFRSTPIDLPTPSSEELVKGLSDAIGILESRGHFGPFAVVLDQKFFLLAQTPTGSMVLPQDRIIPFLGGGSLLRSSILPYNTGLVIALSGAPVELVLARDLTLHFLQQTEDANYLFRVSERMVLRIKEREAIVRLRWPPEPTIWSVRPFRGQAGITVEITGDFKDYSPITAVHFGAANANIVRQNDSTIRVTVPAKNVADPATVHVQLFDAGGAGLNTSSPFDEFTYG